MNTSIHHTAARRLAALACLSTAMLASHAAMAAPSAMGCLIEPERIADVGSPVIGVIESMEVDRGQTVKMAA